MVFPVIMYGCDSWTVKKAEHQRIGALELCCWQTIESTLDSKKIKPVHPKGNQSWIFIGIWCNMTDAKVEAPILWSPDMKTQLMGKDPDAGKDWRQEEKGMKEDEMIGWHHWLNGREFKQTLGDGEGQGRACQWGPKESYTTERLNSNKVSFHIRLYSSNFSKVSRWNELQIFLSLLLKCTLLSEFQTQILTDA